MDLGQSFRILFAHVLCYELRRFELNRVPGSLTLSVGYALTCLLALHSPYVNNGDVRSKNHWDRSLLGRLRR